MTDGVISKSFSRKSSVPIPTSVTAANNLSLTAAQIWKTGGNLLQLVSEHLNYFFVCYGLECSFESFLFFSKFSNTIAHKFEVLKELIVQILAIGPSYFPVPCPVDQPIIKWHLVMILKDVRSMILLPDFVFFSN